MIKSIQRFQGNAPSSPTDVTIAAVDMSKAMVTMDFISHEAQDTSLRTYLLNATTVRIEGDLANGRNYAFEVIEYL